MTNETKYPIGRTGLKWGPEERSQWLAAQEVKRLYSDEVLAKIEPLKQDFEAQQYGSLSCDTQRYPLWALKTRNWDAAKPSVLVTGGVHGYETSGVQGAIRFLQERALSYSDVCNIVVAPCLSPWGYETVNRWNPNAVDPNRSFVTESACEESAALMCYVRQLGVGMYAHFDLHETTDTDNSEFRPALMARDNVHHELWDIPDGFYLVGDCERPVETFQKQIIAAVEKVTHIAPADGQGRLIGEALAQPGVINYQTQALGLCAGFSQCKFGTTTEVYPDSPLVDDENCIKAQVAAVTGGLDYLVAAEFPGMANPS